MSYMDPKQVDHLKVERALLNIAATAKPSKGIDFFKFGRELRGRTYFWHRSCSSSVLAEMKID